jgi:hypothetical protein
MNVSETQRTFSIQIVQMMRQYFANVANVGQNICAAAAPLVQCGVRRASSSPATAGISGVVAKVFAEQGYGIVQDALQREYFFRLDNNALATVNSAPVSPPAAARQLQGGVSTSWRVGMHVLFTPRERANQPYDRRFVAEQVCLDTALSQSMIVTDALARMEDDQWRRVLADVDSDHQGSYPSATRYGDAPSSSVANFPPGYDIRYLVLEQDLKTPIMGTKRRNPLDDKPYSDGDDAFADDDELLQNVSAMERARREAEEIDLHNISAFR